MIAAQACILRKRANGTPITDPSELINCAGFRRGRARQRSQDRRPGQRAGAPRRRDQPAQSRRPLHHALQQRRHQPERRAGCQLLEARSRHAGGSGPDLRHGAAPRLRGAGRCRVRRGRPADRQRSDPLRRSARGERPRRIVRAGLPQGLVPQPGLHLRRGPGSRNAVAAAAARVHGAADAQGVAATRTRAWQPRRWTKTSWMSTTSRAIRWRDFARTVSVSCSSRWIRHPPASPARGTGCAPWRRG